MYFFEKINQNDKLIARLINGDLTADLADTKWEVMDSLSIVVTGLFPRSVLNWTSCGGLNSF